MSTRQYRLLVADDEYWSRESLKTMLRWEDYSIIMLEPASDGEEVLERIPTECPDIILTDIDMPFMDGLTLMGKLKEDWPEIVCIAVSGYDDFQKVKGFFIAGGVDYLLKPISREELAKVLGKALTLLSQREQKKKQDDNVIRQQIRLASSREDGEYSAFLNEKLYGRKENAPAPAPDFRGGPVSSMLVRFYDTQMIGSLFHHDMLSYAQEVKNILKDLASSDLDASPAATVFHYTSKVNEFILFGAFDADWLRRLGSAVIARFSAAKYGPVTVVIHDEPCLPENIGSSYREMMTALAERPFTRDPVVLFCSKAGKNTPFRIRLDQRIENELTRLLQAGQTEEAASLLLEGSGFSQSAAQGWTFVEAAQFIAKAGNILAENVKRRYPNKAGQLEDALDMAEHAVNILDGSEACEVLRTLLQGLDAGDSVPHPDTGAGQAAAARRFIEENYSQVITLTDLASRFHLDPSYLSRLFSKEYGETVTAFITRIRIEHAIELMQDPEKRLDTISFLVGYDDYHYFSRVFRKKMGLSPSEYRKAMPD